MKDKLESEIFNDKKIYRPRFFSVITKNLIWKFLTKNLVTFRGVWYPNSHYELIVKSKQI